MRLDTSAEGRARMTVRVQRDLDAWLARFVETKDLALGVEAISIEPDGEGAEGWAVTVALCTGKVIGRGKNRKRETTEHTWVVEEFPPRSTWWYMTNGDGQ